MADLRRNRRWMSVLLKHLAEREGAFEYFYCDSQERVTIATGYLVDQRGGSITAGKKLARQLAQRSDVAFTNQRGTPATVADVEADWERVKRHGQAHNNLRASSYKKVAQLRIDRATINAITQTIVNRFLDQLYQKRSYMLSYDPRVAMALVDVRYNPGGVVLYGSGMKPFWNALDPIHPNFNIARAVTLFEQEWMRPKLLRGQPPYFYRHQQRVMWLREGLTAMGGTNANASAR